MCQYAHAVVAARGDRATNEKHLVKMAGLDAVDSIIAAAQIDPSSLSALVGDVHDLVRRTLTDAQR